MKLYLFQCGTIRIRRDLIEGGSVGALEVPVPFFLIEHNGCRVLFDLGYSRSAIDASETGVYCPVVSESDYVLSHLMQIGLKANDITHIVLSHLHDDHCGGLEAFQGIPCFLQKKELVHAGNLSLEQQFPMDWHWLGGDYDLLGDGRIKILFTPGHSAGHQSVLLTLDSGKSVLLAADAVCNQVAFNQRFLPTSVYDRSVGLKTYEKIDAMLQNGVQIIYGHDPEQWDALLSGGRRSCLE
jgi:glyoxylase-like metal-dependent hydrolase (beta-lactamase superfamily II)